ncbi:hypothetical protein ED733_000670 [Metarhizium rileyi]|uniref:Uncharacterized protein n=1 Tax=Metarhizium rileyi (strain RCEF 4871) TaxID=1649241 RepID=A0A5C6G157_METRR|nr:hypothetical protein ED733_000670 [Metarhizium rileyi]
MVRIAAISLLAFAVSALAAPQGPSNDNEEILNSQGKPLSENKKAEFMKLQEEGDKKFQSLLKTYTPKQNQIESELNEIDEKINNVLESE